MAKKKTVAPGPKKLLPSGHICEPLNDNKVIDELVVSKDEHDYPYKISIDWTCFHRHYRYKTLKEYKTDLEVLLPLTTLNEIERMKIWESLT